MKEQLIRCNYEKAVCDKFSKIILVVVMPDKTKEIIVNDNVVEKLDYINTAYDKDLKLKSNQLIKIEDYLLVRR